MFRQVAQIVPVTEAEGPGRRFALWFQGCPLRCPGCCNPEMLPFTGGMAISLNQVLEKIAHATRNGIEGITLLGGEPMAHAGPAACLARAVRANGLSVMIFSGYLLEDLRRSDDPGIHDLLTQTDLLVDGPYRADLPEKHRRWIGSANQRVHFLTDRYSPDDPCWLLSNTLEIRLAGKELVINGYPGRTALGLWKRLKHRS